MRTEINIAGEDAAGRNYLTWAPVRATIKLLEPEGVDPVEVVLGNDDAAHGGQLEFATARNQPRAATLNLTLPADGSEVEFFVAGEFPKPSSADGDAVVEAAHAGTGVPLSTTAVMVRIRKDANGLSPAERDRFTTALATLNDSGAGIFRDFRAMHRQQVALDQAHGRAGFLSWHRAYLLDLERELQKIDSSVTLPYWRFDKPAPNVFTPEFMGRSNPGPLGPVTFSPTNLLRNWQTDGQPGITRRPGFDVLTAKAFVIDDAMTLLLGGPRPNAIFGTGRPFEAFVGMEDNPHGRAHTSFSGWIHDPPTAPKDPLFFLLHCNADRLWARWQWFNNRFDGTRANTFFFRGIAGDPGAALIGHNLRDTMWPWDNDRVPPRPTNAPRTPFPTVPTAPGPGATPTVGDMIDYQGFLNGRSYTDFGYDDVPYGVAP
ncbi:MAG TPA: tyrosinase family protein [Gaiellaceae bacterium]|nr:tyrosinase family protein [Gaiellaceae bacterium]